MDFNWIDTFSPVSEKEWKQLIQFQLQGEDYNQKMIWKSLEEINVKPFYTSEDLEKSVRTPLSTHGNWKIGQVVYVQNAALSNQRALEIIEAGVESIVFVLPDENSDLDVLFKEVPVKEIDTHIVLNSLSASQISQLEAHLKGVNYFLHLDIVGNLCKTGNWYFNLDKDLAFLKESFSKSDSRSKVSVDMALYQNAGATIVQQLAYGLAHANEYLSAFGNELGNTMVFNVSVGGNYFFEIAKLRALRLLWKTLTDAYDNSVKCHIVASPTLRNKTIYDFNTNMLRTSTECMSAILGGADTIINHPYDVLYHKSNAFGDRIARNQLLILKRESYFDKVKNPTEGSYYIESLTNQLAEKALDVFKNIEASGGFLQQLKTHKIQQKIRESAQKEQLAFDSEELKLVGTNVYSNEKDRMKEELELYPFVKTDKRKTLIEPIIPKRLAESVEQKRLNDE